MFVIPSTCTYLTLTGNCSENFDQKCIFIKRFWWCLLLLVEGLPHVYFTSHKLEIDQSVMHGGKIHILNITRKIFFSINKNSSCLKWCHQHFWIIYRPVTLVLRLILNWKQSMNIRSKIIKLQGHWMGNLKSHSTANLPRKSIRKELKSVMKLS